MHRESPRRRLRSLALVTGALGVVAVAVAPATAAAPAPAVLTGKVTGVDGRPLGNVIVAFVAPDARGGQVVDRSTRTNSAGVYTFTGDLGTTDEYLQFIAVGRATGGTSATGYSDRCYGGPAPSCVEAPGKTVTVAAGTRRTINVTLARAGVITGRAVDATGRGLGRVPVTVWPGSPDFAADALTQPVLVTATDANGNYRLPASAYAGYSVCFASDDGAVYTSITPISRFGYTGGCYGYSPKPVVVRAGGTTMQNTTLRMGAALGGTVVGADGAPIKGATVTADGARPFGPPPAATTGSAGTFALYGISSGPTSWCVDAPNYREVCSAEPVTLAPGVVTSIGKVVLQLVS